MKLLLLLSLLFANSVYAFIQIPLIDDQPISFNGCPITNTAHTENQASDEIGVRNYRCVIDGRDIVWSIAIPRACENGGCGLIMDVHGATMSADQQDKGTRLREFGWRAMEQGASTPYIVAQPNMTDLFDKGIDFASVLGGPYENEMSGILYFINDAISAFNIDQNRMHMHGFSRGAGTVGLFYCDQNYRYLFTSYSVAGGGLSCELNDKPLLGLNGLGDTTPAAENANGKLIDQIKTQANVQTTLIHEDADWQNAEKLGLLRTKGKYSHQRFESGNHTLETITHSGNTWPTDGHCHPASDRGGWLVCFATFDTGQKLVDFYIRSE